MQSRLLPVLTTLIVLTSVGAGRTVDAQSFYEGKTVRDHRRPSAGRRLRHVRAE